MTSVIAYNHHDVKKMSNILKCVECVDDNRRLSIKILYDILDSLYVDQETGEIKTSVIDRITIDFCDDEKAKTVSDKIKFIYGIFTEIEEKEIQK